MIGLDAKLYYNANTYASPSWTELTNVKDVSLSMDAGEADASTRGSGGWKITEATLRSASIEFEMTWDTSKAWFIALRDAYLAGTLVEMACMDGAIATSGKEGLRAGMSVTEFMRNEPLEGVVTVSVTVKPGPSADANPAWYEVPA